MTRLEAAEKEVVRAADAFTRKLGGAQVITPAGADVWRDLYEACARLRDLRERAAEEECGARGVYIHATTVRCHLQRGHEGKHQGELGLWRWE